MAITPLQSRIEEILNGSTSVTPRSRIEILLIELMQFIETGMSSVFHYKGSVSTYAELLLIENPEIGDVYNVQTDNMNYAWDGTSWDTLGAVMVIDSVITSDSQNPVTSSAIYAALVDKANTADLATVATSGSYDDLTNKPTIPAAQVNADWNAASGVAQILNKPTIPEAQVNSDWSAASGVAQILNKPTLGNAAAMNVWTGTRQQYEALVSDDYNFYCITEAVSSL